jgi:hypothetical protein
MAVLLRRRSEADRLSAAFARLLAGERSLAPAPLLGLEHEFRVIVGDEVVDFRSFIHQLPIPGRRLDPGDSNAYRGDWGGTITADGPEAEIAIAPLALRAGFGDALLDRAHIGRGLLEDALPAGTTLEGYSTHLSVAVPVGLEECVARAYVDTFAPALMLLLDGPESPGLLVRPRHGRLELGGEFVDGRRLEAAAAFAAGSVLATVRAVRRWPAGAWLERLRAEMPPQLRVDVAPALGRYGWFVGRSAFGADLYVGGRATELRLAGAGTARAGEHLQRSWTIARRALEPHVAPRELAATDAVVEGREALGLELHHARSIAFAPRRSDPEPTVPATPEPFGAVMAVRERPGFDAIPQVVSWDFVVLRLEDAVTTAYACLPRDLLGAGLAALDAGRLDGLLRAYLAAQGGAPIRLLASAGQTGRAGLFGAVGRAADLIAPEPGPPGRDKRRDDRQDQRDQPNQPADEAGPPSGEAGGATPAATAAVAGVAAAGLTIFGLPAAAAAAIGGAAVVAVVGGAVLLGGGPGGSPSAAPNGTGTPVASQPSMAPSVVATPDLSGLQAAYLAFSKAFTDRQAAGNGALDVAVDAADQSAAYQMLVDAYEQAIIDLRAIDLPTDLDPAQDDMLAALADAADIYRRLVADPSVSDPTIDPSLRDLADRVGQAATVIRAGLGLPPPSGGSTDSCIAQSAYDVLTREFGDPGFGVSNWTAADVTAVSDGLTAWHPTASFDQDWKLNLEVALVAGDDQQAQALLGRIATGEIRLTPCSGSSPTGPSPPPESFGPEFTSGTATMSVSESAVGTVAGMAFNGESGTALEGGPTYPTLDWADASGRNSFSIKTLTAHAIGHLSTADGTLGVGWFFDQVDWGGFPDWYPSGLGLAEPEANGICTATIETTPTGGITGHVSCSNLNDPTLPVSLEADFTAEP